MAIWLNNIKALLVVLVLATIVIAIAKPFCLRFMTESDFLRRRNIWYALTLTAFMSPSFWLFVLIATPILFWGARKDQNPVALYLLMLQAIPPNIGFQLPTIAINQLFELNLYRILSFTIFFPVAWRLYQSTDKMKERSSTIMGILILSYFALNLALLMPYESITNTMRRGFLLFADALIVYFVVSRTCVNQRTLAESMASYCLAAAIFASLAIFESARGWLLYRGIGVFWGDAADFAYLFRDGILRAQVSAGHSIQLGYFLAIGFGFWLYLSSHAKGTLSTRVIAILICAGLAASQSRGPWTCALTIFIAYSALGPNSSRRLFNALLIMALLTTLIIVSPIGESIIQRLPFIGTIDTDNIAYRQQLANVAWELITKNPFFGVPHVTVYLESLRQGQGIIDLVNVYATIAMSYGLVGLFFFIGFFLLGLWNSYRLARKLADINPDLSLLGVCLISCMLGTLLVMGTSAYQFVLFKMFYILAGFAAGYVSFGNDNKVNQLRNKNPARLTHPPQPIH